MGNKNHATVILACRKIANLLDKKDIPVVWETSLGRREMDITAVLGKLESSINR